MCSHHSNATDDDGNGDGDGADDGDGDDGDGEVMITGEKCDITCSSDRQLHQGGAEASKGDAEEDSAKVFNRFKKKKIILKILRIL